MENPPRKYSKQSKALEMFPQRIQEKSFTKVPEEAVFLKDSSVYLKPDKEIPAKTFVVIISGGEEREKKYFKIISNKEKFPRIKIEFIADPTNLTPLGMFEIAKFKKERYLSSQNKEIDAPDNIYLVSDVDEFRKELLEIIPKCKNEGLHLSISNPCFEIWLYFAFQPDLPAFPIPERLETISWKLKEWLPSVIKGGINPTKAIFSIQENIRNAQLNYAEDEQGIPQLFATNLFELAKEIYPHIEEEITKMKDENKKREEKYRIKKP
jgi:hypothetical protein